jgi:hypothetical protein
MNREFKYVVPPVGESEFPEIPRGEAAILSCQVHPGNEVCIIGNSEGLIYLAKYLAAMALLEKRNGLHVHLDPESGELEAGSSMLTVCNVDFGND